MIALGVVAALLLVAVVVLGALLVTRSDEDTSTTDATDTPTETTNESLTETGLIEEGSSTTSETGLTGNSLPNSASNSVSNQVDVNDNNTSTNNTSNTTVGTNNAGITPVNNNANNTGNGVVNANPGNEAGNNNQPEITTTFSVNDPANRAYNAGNVTFGAAFKNGKAGQFITVSVSSRGGSVSNLGPCQILYTAANKTCQINVPHDTYFGLQNARYRATFTLYDTDRSVISTQRQDFEIRR